MRADAIIMCDDDSDQLEICKFYLDNAGIENYVLCSEEADFFNKLTDETPLAIIDHIMNGEIRGFAIAREIARRNIGKAPIFKCKIIVVSQLKTVEIIQEHMNSGHVMAFFGKGEAAFMDRLISLVKNTLDVVQGLKKVVENMKEGIEGIQNLKINKEVKSGGG